MKLDEGTLLDLATHVSSAQADLEAVVRAARRCPGSRANLIWARADEALRLVRSTARVIASADGADDGRTS